MAIRAPSRSQVPVNRLGGRVEVRERGADEQLGNEIGMGVDRCSKSSVRLAAIARLPFIFQLPATKGGFRAFARSF